MNRCPNCAAQNRDGAKFCTSCGFRLPPDAPVSVASERSPFATTSTVPASAEPVQDVVEESAAFGAAEAGWPTDETVTAPVSGPGLSWDSEPPRDTSVPVSDEMIAGLVVNEAEPEDGDDPVEPELVDDSDLSAISAELESSDTSGPDAVVRFTDETSFATGTPTIDQLLRLARELEYGLVELADSFPLETSETPVEFDSRLLTNALRDLQTDDDLAPLRESITTAQDRPRDVDVMLDLVLRADAIASLLTERDQLKHAIELALAVGNPAPTAEFEPTSENVSEVDSNS